MFEAVSSEDKTMMIIGTAEHLIVESDKQTGLLLDALDSWLTDHCPAEESEDKVGAARSTDKAS